MWDPAGWGCWSHNHKARQVLGCGWPGWGGPWGKPVHSTWGSSTPASLWQQWHATRPPAPPQGNKRNAPPIHGGGGDITKKKSPGAYFGVQKKMTGSYFLENTGNNKEKQLNKKTITDVEQSIPYSLVFTTSRKTVTILLVFICEMLHNHPLLFITLLFPPSRVDWKTVPLSEYQRQNTIVEIPLLHFLKENKRTDGVHFSIANELYFLISTIGNFNLYFLKL